MGFSDPNQNVGDRFDSHVIDAVLDGPNGKYIWRYDPQTAPSQNYPGTVTVNHWSGAVERFAPVADNRAARSTALTNALDSIVHQPSANLPGDVVQLDPGVDYELSDYGLDDKSGWKLKGNGNTIHSASTWNQQMLVQRCDNIAVEDVTFAGATADPLNPTNTGVGQGFRCFSCEGVTLTNVKAINQSGIGSSASDDDYEHSISSHGIDLRTCDDVTLNGCETRYCGRYGVELVDCVRISIKNHESHEDGRTGINIANDDVNPETIVIDGYEGTATIDHSGSPGLPAGAGISIGDGVVYSDAVVTISNATANNQAMRWAGSLAGVGFPVFKITDVGTLTMRNVKAKHLQLGGANNSTPIDSIFLNNVEKVTLSNVWTSGVFQVDSGRIDTLTFQDCQINVDNQRYWGMYDIECRVFKMDSSEVHFGGKTSAADDNFAIDLDILSDSQIEITNSTFVGAVSTAANNVVFYDSCPIETIPGQIVFADNKLTDAKVAGSTAQAAATAKDRRLLCSTFGRDKNTLAWYASADLPDPADGTPTDVFPGLPGKTGMRIRNTEYTPNGTTAWAVAEAYYTSSGEYVE